MVELHQPVSKHLRHDRGAADHIAEPIAANDRPARGADGRGDRPVHQDEVGWAGQLKDGLPHRQQARLQDVVSVDLLGAREAESHIRMLQDNVKGPRPLPGRQTFAVVDAGGKALPTKDDRRGDNRTRPWTAPGFIHASDAAEALGPSGCGRIRRVG